MESQLVKRRISTISGHFAVCTDDLSAETTHLLPLNCSSSLSTARPVTRLDNSLLFARQGSSAQGCFMRQASSDPHISNSSSTGTTSPYTRLDSRMFFARQGSASQGTFMRQASSQLGNWGKPETIEYKDVNGIISSNAPQERPLFSRPNKVVPSLPSFGETKQEPYVSFTTVAPAPKFARPNCVPPSSVGATISSQNNGKQWSPRMNVEESNRDYNIILELPGVDASDIRVEVNNKILMVTGRGSSKWSSLNSCSNSEGRPSITTCHKREISQGPYQVIWPLPTNVNKNNISAELIDGILQVTIPKV